MSASAQTRVMIVDDHSIVRDDLEEVVNGACGLEVVGQARNGARPPIGVVATQILFIRYIRSGKKSNCTVHT